MHFQLLAEKQYITIGYEFFEKFNKKPTVVSKERAKVQKQPKRGGQKRIVCKNCKNRVTTLDEIIEIQGRHRHTFFNPAGVLFEIGCFSQAPGCLVRGFPSKEFVWFEGHTWQYSMCSTCQNHLGWYFSKETAVDFFGLILNRLTTDILPNSFS